MIPHRSPTVDPTKILTRQELRLVLADLKRQAERSKQGHVNLILFRLAACCGLRASEIAQLRMADVRTDGSRPHLRIRRAAAKGHKARVVPLWWDAGTLADHHGVEGAADASRHAGPDDLFLVSPRPGRAKITFSRHTLRRRFRTACKVLGLARLDHADDPSRPAHVHQPCLGRRENARRSPRRRRACQRQHHVGVSARGGGG